MLGEQDMTSYTVQQLWELLEEYVDYELYEWGRELAYTEVRDFLKFIEKTGADRL